MEGFIDELEKKAKAKFEKIKKKYVWKLSQKNGSSEYEHRLSIRRDITGDMLISIKRIADDIAPQHGVDQENALKEVLRLTALYNKKINELIPV